LSFDEASWGHDGDQMLERHQWFVRRHPAPLARLKYMRRQTASVLDAGTKK
jgi:hypothetical protein